MEETSDLIDVLESVGCLPMMPLIKHFIKMVLSLGAAVIVSASVIIHNDHEYRVIDDGILPLPIFCLVVGIAILLLVFLGCDGNMRRNPCMLKTYAWIALALVIAETILGVLIFQKKGEVDEVDKDSMKSIMNRYGLGDNALDASLDAAQQDLECCGVMSYTDWSNFNYTGVADGCCKEMTQGCGVDYFNNTSPPDLWETGCYTSLMNEIEPFYIALGIFSIALAVFLFISMICACGMYGKSR
ncbi:unnamed protein product, partial [Meganyctiphanes norvegica]